MGVTVAPPPLRWAVIITDLDPTRGHEQRGTRRTLVVSYEPFHRSGSITVCPITAARSMPKYPNEVAIPVGEAGQTRASVILCHQARTISLPRATGTLSPIGYLTDPALRERVRLALAQHLGLDIPAGSDGAAGNRAF